MTARLDSGREDAAVVVHRMCRPLIYLRLTLLEPWESATTQHQTCGRCAAHLRHLSIYRADHEEERKQECSWARSENGPGCRRYAVKYIILRERSSKPAEVRTSRISTIRRWAPNIGATPSDILYFQDAQASLQEYGIKRNNEPCRNTIDEEICSPLCKLYCHSPVLWRSNSVGDIPHSPSEGPTPPSFATA
jgi:hypothetical protein